MTVPAAEEIEQILAAYASNEVICQPPTVFTPVKIAGFVMDDKGDVTLLPLSRK